MKRRPGVSALVVGSVVWAAGACRDASANPARWTRVIRDANYSVAIDTSRIALRMDFNYVVWYRTDHAMPRLHNGKTFDREIVQSIVDCGHLWYKVVSVDMSQGDHRPISRQRTSPGEIAWQPWRRVTRGSVEEVAAQAACHFAKRRK